jgi:hypothetical protein
MQIQLQNFNRMKFVTILSVRDISVAYACTYQLKELYLYTLNIYIHFI